MSSYQQIRCIRIWVKVRQGRGPVFDTRERWVSRFVGVRPCKHFASVQATIRPVKLFRNNNTIFITVCQLRDIYIYINRARIATAGVLSSSRSHCAAAKHVQQRVLGIHLCVRTRVLVVHGNQIIRVDVCAGREGKMCSGRVIFERNAELTNTCPFQAFQNDFDLTLLFGPHR